MTLARLFPVLLLVACNDTGVKVYNTPPGVSIVTPVDGQAFGPGELVEFYGVAEDSQDDPTSLLISWASNLDGELGADPPDSEGTVYFATTALTGGDHAITLTAVDTSGESASTAISISVEQGSSSVGAPTVVLVGPSEGSTYVEGETVTFVGAVTDPDQSWETITTRLTSDLDGTFWEGNPDSGGTVSVPWEGLSAGNHTVTLQAEDQDGNVGTDAVSFEVGEDGRPSVTIVAPADGDTFSLDEDIVLEGQVSDRESDTEELLVTWSSSLDGTLYSGAPNSSGSALAAVSLSGGTHIITLTCYDPDGKEGTDAISVSVVDPNDVDDDYDGYTENEGDCDDADSAANPGEAEECDETDNDCDGQVNEDFMDDYESNETPAAPYDIGEIDSGFFWTGDSAAISGLSLHSDTDADCFTWDADDEIYDNIAIDIVVGTFRSTGTYSATLYMKDGGSWDAKDSASGTRMTLSYEGDYFDTDEDEWAICVTSTDWAVAACDGSAPYTIEIDS